MEMVDTARRIRSAFDFGLYEVTFTGRVSQVFLALSKKIFS